MSTPYLYRHAVDDHVAPWPPPQIAFLQAEYPEKNSALGYIKLRRLDTAGFRPSMTRCSASRSDFGYATLRGTLHPIHHRPAALLRRRGFYEEAFALPNCPHMDLTSREERASAAGN